MERLRVFILFGTKPNFDKDAFKYFILYVNKIQNTYEFSFPDVADFPFNYKGDVEFESSQKKLSKFISSKKLKADHFITIITNSFNNNFFFNAEHKASIITTDVWEKSFSPPSLFEYLLHCIYSCLIYSQVKPDLSEISDEQLLINIGSHPDTRGCIADFTRQKTDDRIDIALGYVCEEHKKELEDYYGREYLHEVQRIIERNWIGDIDTKNSVAYNLKHFFRFDINKDSGFNKSLWDEIKDKFYELPGSLTGEVLKVILTALLIYFLVMLGVMDEK